MADGLDKELQGHLRRSVEIANIFLNGKVTAFFEAVKERTLVFAKFVKLILMYPMGVYQM